MYKTVLIPSVSEFYFFLFFVDQLCLHSVTIATRNFKCRPISYRRRVATLCNLAMLDYILT